MNPKKSLNKAFLKQRPLRSEIKLFKSDLRYLHVITLTIFITIFAIAIGSILSVRIRKMFYQFILKNFNEQPELWCNRQLSERSSCFR